ncbi:hypothetical protein AVEN_149727-1 [Araneus ventricosus]|uniref:Uncharacterized protein n=1 Tax=Araneus ventricosus TaxID=182803 RepID=A0A4Y2VHA9_ARAVE|nr:hypothetical protein AVEN_149727-1 [Araneus ventricosus]
MFRLRQESVIKLKGKLPLELQRNRNILKPVEEKILSVTLLFETERHASKELQRYRNIPLNPVEEKILSVTLLFERRDTRPFGPPTKDTERHACSSCRHLNISACRPKIPSVTLLFEPQRHRTFKPVDQDTERHASARETEHFKPVDQRYERHDSV